MLETLLLAVLAGSSLLVAHSYIIYPLLLYALVAAGWGSDPTRTGDLPTVSLVIAAYNEEEVIAEKIENSLGIDYPDDRMEIVVFSDASTDRTDEIVRSYEDRGVALLRIDGRVGKTECQNRAVAATNGEVIVFSDANSMYDPDAIRHLIAGFGEGVGCVAGELQYREESDVEGESMYWRYESKIKELESAVNSTVTGNGSIYAISREAYVPLPAEAISDFAEPLAIITEGKRVIYEPDAIAWEDTGSSVGEELGRRSRIVTRSWHTVASHAHLLNPLSYPTFAFQLGSHKVLRWLTPVFLVAILGSTVGLVAVSSSPLYLAVLGAQLVCYALAGVGAVLDRLGRETPTVAHVPYYFLVANYGMARGLANFLSGRNIVTWETVSRDD